MMDTICGVDVSKPWLDGWIEAGGYRRFANDAAGIADLARWATGHGSGLVVIEASGGIEQAAFLALWRAGLPCALTNPRAVRKFAEAMGKLEKTERIDAEVIARHAAARRISPTQPASQEQQRLTAPDEHDPVWAALDRTFRSVKGVAGRTVAVLLAELPEIGGGRAAVRSILFLVADIARKYDPTLAEFRQRLLDQGKPKMVARIALARKLLVRRNAKPRATRLARAS